MTNREKCHDLLVRASGGWVRTADFLQAGCGSRFGARIMELREQGLEIESELERPGSWRYRLVGTGVGGGDATDQGAPTGHPADPSPEPLCLYRDYTDPQGEWMRLPYSEVLAA